ncbi:putative non-specific serine/threonine protein kinase [Helianthus annuus]|nr:putative non-specific serine/threonine protein kinase [Helianthus annuus]
MFLFKYCKSVAIYRMMEERIVIKAKLIFGFLIVISTSITCPFAADTVSANQTVRYNETIISPQESFELGFFRPGKSMNFYVGIWYKNLPNKTVVWVANRNTPLTHTSGELTLTLQGALIIRDATNGHVVWSSANSSTTSVKNPIGQLLDTGNFIIYEEGEGISQEDPKWQSFDFMTDTLLPGMKFGWNLIKGIDRHFTSCKSVDDPAAVITRLVLSPSGRPERLLWSESKQEWSFYDAPETDACDQYALCGPFGSCNIQNSPACSCLKGFEPRSPHQWRNIDWSQGCRHSIPLDCDPAEGFNKYSNLKLPDTRESWYNQTMTLVECEKMCKSKCSCTAYTNTNISGTGSGCLLWFGPLMDIKTYAENGDTLYIRVSASELDSIENRRSSNAGRRIRVIVPVSFVVLAILVSLCLFYHFYMKKQQHQGLSLLMHGSAHVIFYLY